MIVSAVRGALLLRSCLIECYLRPTYRLSGELKSCHITGAHTRLQVVSMLGFVKGERAAKLNRAAVPHA